MRKSRLRRMIKAAVGMTLAMAMTVTGIQVSDTSGDVTFSKIAEAATVSDKVPLVAYTRYSGNLTTYSEKELRNGTGYICAGDQCTILNFYDNGAVQVRYPVKKGTRTAYASTSGFLINTDFSTNTMKLGTGKNAYRKSTGNTTIGSVYKDDDVVIIGHENGRTELIYPTSSGFKLGWVDGTYQIPANNTLRNPSSWSITEAQAKTVMFQARYYADTYSDLKAAFGYNENSLYNHYLNYGIREGRSASPIFDPVFYLNNNSDLKKAFGNDYTQVYRHWINYGCKEGRRSSKYYDGNYYRTKYSDLNQAFFASGTRDGYFELARHYLNYGISEKRQANSEGYLPNVPTSGFDPIWPCDTYIVTTLYKYSKGGHHSCHFKYGIDIGGRYGENVYAVENGTVMTVKNLGNKSFGKYIYIKHDNGRISVYAHLSSQDVTQGTRVSKGQVIGKIGNTGGVATHLHFELGYGNVSPASNDGGDPWAEFYSAKYGGRTKITNRQDRW